MNGFVFICSQQKCFPLERSSSKIASKGILRFMLPLQSPYLLHHAPAFHPDHPWSVPNIPNMVVT